MFNKDPNEQRFQNVKDRPVTIYSLADFCGQTSENRH